MTSRRASRWNPRTANGGGSSVRRLAVCVWLAAGWLLLVPMASGAQTPDGIDTLLAIERSVQTIIEQAEPAVVAIERSRRPPSTIVERAIRRVEEGPDLQPRDILPNEFAAGVLIAQPGTGELFVLTAAHAVKGGPTVVPREPTGALADVVDDVQLVIRLATRHAIPARILASDPRSDLAVLQLDWKAYHGRKADVRAIAWPASAPARKGMLTITLGNPYWIARDGSASASWGLVTNLARRPALLHPPDGRPLSLQSLGGVMQLEQRLPIGTSGSPVINLRGELMGLTTALAAIEGYERSGGFAIPLDPSTRWIVESLLAGTEVDYGFLGVGPVTIQVGLDPSLRGRLTHATAAGVAWVPAGGPAALAGLRQGDVLTALNGQPVASDLDLMRLVTLNPPETTIALTVYRPETRAELTLHPKLGKCPVFKEEEGAIIAAQRKFPLWRGLAVDYPTARGYKDGRLSTVAAAVLVLEVQPGSPAHAAGLQAGDFVSHVEQKEVRTPREFHEAVQSLTGPVKLWNPASAKPTIVNDK